MLLGVNPWSMVQPFLVDDGFACELQKATAESNVKLRKGETVTDTTNSAAGADEWFYTARGQRLGPLNGGSIRQLLDDQKIDADTPLWRKGQTDWKPLRDTEFVQLLGDAPPPIPASNINDGLVWTLAFAPIAYALITAVLRAAAEESPSPAITDLASVSIFLPIVVNAVLCLLDLRQLRRAGYSDGFLTLWGLILAPAYLFMRAKRLRHKPTYAIAWLIMFAISLFIA